MRKQKEPEASILSLRENITTFVKDLEHAWEAEIAEAKKEKDEKSNH